jgi:anti-anti-sigma factor
MKDDVAILEPKGMLLGGSETTDLRARIQQLAEAGTQRLVLDLGKLTYMSSPGIGLLMETYVSYSKRSAEVRLCRVDKRIKKIFAIVRLNLIFGNTDYESVEDAIASTETATTVSP